MTNIAFFNLRDNEEVFFRKNLKGLNVDYFQQPIQELNPAGFKDYSVISILGLSRIDKNILNSLPNVKLITTRSTGFDQIDISETKKRNILVANVPTYGEVTVAEYTVALLLALIRKIPQAIEKVKKERSFSSERLEGFDLYGKTLGVIGTGHIGAHVIKIAKGFGMMVIAFDVSPNEKFSKELEFKYVSLEDILKNSDIITLHVPLLPSTKHLINIKNINLLKKGAVIVNTSRGEVLENKALLKGLRSGILAAAALDVLENEKLLRVSRNKQNSQASPTNKFTKELEELLEMDNVIVSPHNAYNTKEAKLRILETTVENIKSFLKGKPINLVKT